MCNAMIIDPKDNVAVAIEAIQSGDTVTYLSGSEEKSLTARQDITIYHKLAVCDISKGFPHLQVRRAHRHLPPATSRPASMSTSTMWRATARTSKPRHKGKGGKR